MSIRCSGVRQPQLHHRQQAVAAGDDPRLGAEPLERRDRALDAGRTLVLEWRGGLQRAPLRSGALGGQPLARRADVLALLVLHGRVGADHRRDAAASPAPSWRTSGYSEPRREAAALDVAQHRAGRAQRGDRRLAAEPRERQRALACRPRRSAAARRRCSRGSRAGPRPRRPGRGPRRGRPRRSCPAFLTSRPSSSSTPASSCSLIAVTTSLTGALFSTISPTPRDHLVEPGGDLAQRQDRRDEEVDEREHDQQDRDEDSTAPTALIAPAPRRRGSRRASRRSRRARRPSASTWSCVVSSSGAASRSLEPAAATAAIPSTRRDDAAAPPAARR